MEKQMLTRRTLLMFFFFSAFPGKTHHLQMYDSMTLDGMAGQPTPANVPPSEINAS